MAKGKKPTFNSTIETLIHNGSVDKTKETATAKVTQLSAKPTQLSDSDLKLTHISTKPTQLSASGDTQDKPDRKHRNFKHQRELRSERGNFCLTASTFAKLREIASATGQSLSTIVDKAIVSYYERFTAKDSS